MTPAQRFSNDGFLTLQSVLDADSCQTLSSRLRIEGRHSAGARNLLRDDRMRKLAASLQSRLGQDGLLPHTHRPVQCTYFEKSVDRNWIVPMHRDESIPVAARVAHAELQGWSVKDGTLHVVAPASLLARLVAVRIHLDDCSEDDGPLCVIPGSHRRDTAGAAPVTCTASRGDALVMSPLLLHASSKATGQSRRRVLHFLFGPSSLPWGLRWPEIDHDSPGGQTASRPAAHQPLKE